MRYPVVIAVALWLSAVSTAHAAPVTLHHRLVDTRACEFVGVALECVPLPGKLAFEITFDPDTVVITDEDVWWHFFITGLTYDIPFEPMANPWSDGEFSHTDFGQAYFFHIRRTIPDFPDFTLLEIGIQDQFAGECEPALPTCRRDWRSYVRITNDVPSTVDPFGPGPTLEDFEALFVGGDFQFYSAAFTQAEFGRTYETGSRVYLARVPEPATSLLFALALGPALLRMRKTRR